MSAEVTESVAVEKRPMTEEVTLAPSMRVVLTIARNTFRESVRDRVFLNLLVFACVVIGVSFLVSDLSAGQEARVITDFGLAAMLVIGSALAIFVGVQLVRREIERRTAYPTLARPINRSHLLVGKHLGLIALLLVNTVAQTSVIAVVLLAKRDLTGARLLSLSSDAGLIFLELTIIVALAQMFSTFAGTTFSALVTLSLVIIGHFSADLLALSSSASRMRAVYLALYYALPNFSRFQCEQMTAHDLWTALLYALAYQSATLALSVMIFARRDLK
ncbi:MAG: ABC transporter permease [Pyrinomonas methylaliphatogenes]|nr:ABC transporter permease [Pyrinomonas methylaliphatogenes]